MKKFSKKLLSVLLVIIMISGTLTISGLTKASAATYSVTSWAQLVPLLQISTDVNIVLKNDIYEESKVDFSGVKISGNKVIDLNGYEINYNYKNNQDDPYMNYWNWNVLFNIPEGASMTINDSVGGGRIAFDAYMVNPYDFVMCAIRDIFTVRGKLVINGGEIEAGRSKEQYVTALVNGNSLYTGYLWQQIYGTAVTLYDNGELIVNGGNVFGRGGPVIYNQVMGEEYSGSAIKLRGNSVATINDGNFCGYGGAPTFYVTGSSKLTVNAGSFETSRLGAMLYNRNGVAVCSTAKGPLGIPDNAWKDNKKYLRITQNGTVYDFGSDKTGVDLDSTDYDTTVENIGISFKWQSPDSNKDSKNTDLGKAYLGTSTMNMTFAFEANKLQQKYINEGYTTNCVTAVLYNNNGIYYDGSGGSVKLNTVATQAGTYKVYQTIELYKKGSYVTELSHIYTVKVVKPVMINDVDVSVEAPSVGTTPKNAVSQTAHTTVTETLWYEITGSGSYDFVEMKPTDVFENGKTYECCVTVVPDEGYALSDSLSASISGDISGFYNKYWDSATFYRTITINEITRKLGDVNNDGRINVLDTTVVQKSIAGFIELTDTEKWAANVNGDRAVNIIDATYIQKYGIGLITEF